MNSLFLEVISSVQLVYHSLTLNEQVFTLVFVGILKVIQKGQATAEQSNVSKLPS